MKKIVLALIVSLVVFLSATTIHAVSPDSPQAVSHKVKVTATVPLSDLWAKEIAKNSNMIVPSEIWVGKEITISVTILGLKNVPLKSDKVYARVISSGQETMLDGTTDDNGTVTFSFTPHVSQEHTIIIIYEKLGRKVELNTQVTFTPSTEVSALPLT